METNTVTEAYMCVRSGIDLYCELLQVKNTLPLTPNLRISITGGDYPHAINLKSNTANEFVKKLETKYLLALAGFIKLHAKWITLDRF